METEGLKPVKHTDNYISVEQLKQELKILVSCLTNDNIDCIISGWDKMALKVHRNQSKKSYCGKQSSIFYYVKDVLLKNLNENAIEELFCQYYSKPYYKVKQLKSTHTDMLLDQLKQQLKILVPRLIEDNINYIISKWNKLAEEWNDRYLNGRDDVFSGLRNSIFYYVKDVLLKDLNKNAIEKLFCQYYNLYLAIVCECTVAIVNPTYIQWIEDFQSEMKQEETSGLIVFPYMLEY